jgi:microcystin-dependent protein
MAEPFLGQIQAFGFNFPPTGWLPCDGQTLQIAQYSALYALLGVTYGGNGSTTFCLPDLRGRVTLHMGQGPGLTNRSIGEKDGTETAALTQAQLPAHSHTVNASTVNADKPAPTNAICAAPQDSNPAPGTGYTQAAANTTMSPAMIGNTGQGQGHPNMQPSLCLNFCIAVSGLFPTRG